MILSSLIFILVVTKVVIADDSVLTTRYTANVTERAKYFSSEAIGTHNTSFHPAIVGGEIAENDEFPWFGRIDMNFTLSWSKFSASCGASLIHSDIAVSAAHCIIGPVQNGATFNIKFNLGANKYSGIDGTVIDVERIMWPTAYSYPENDMVFLKLRKPASLTPVSWNTDPRSVI
jgi:Trypsin